MSSGILFMLTVVPGFEKVLLKECKEKLNGSTQKSEERGQVLIEVPQTVQVNDVLNLKGADRVFLVIYPETSTDYPPTEEQVPDFFKDLFSKIDWPRQLKIWCSILNIRIPNETATQNGNNAFNFRVTCNRSGNKHKFTSVEAASIFGGIIFDEFHWPVNLTKSILVINLDIKNDTVLVKIPLTLKSLHRRNITSFGPNSLRNTVAFNMLRTISINSGDLVCDIMCGGAVIPIEGALNWVDSFHICGEIHPKGCERARENISHIKSLVTKMGELELIKWDATRLPLRDNILNVIVTDLPFGKRCGSKSRNSILYPAMLKEAARVCQRGNSRALFLTNDRASFNMALQTHKKYWRLAHRFVINLGGLQPTIHQLKRTDIKYEIHD